jgi:hypothetical protein
MVLVLEQDRCRFVPNVPLPHKSFCTYPTVLLGDEVQVEPHFGQFRGSANLDARYVYGLRRTYHKHGNLFGRT